MLELRNIVNTRELSPFILPVRYEELVRDTVHQWHRKILPFCGLKAAAASDAFAQDTPVDNSPMDAIAADAAAPHKMSPVATATASDASLTTTPLDARESDVSASATNASALHKRASDASTTTSGRPAQDATDSDKNVSASSSSASSFLRLPTAMLDDSQRSSCYSREALKRCYCVLTNRDLEMMDAVIKIAGLAQSAHSFRSINDV